MSQIFLVGMTTQELTDLIRSTIKEVQNSNSDVTSNTSNNDLLDRFEVAKLLKISLSTLNDWTKKGYIKAYRIGNRVRFKNEDVQSSLKEVKSLKYRRA